MYSRVIHYQASCGDIHDETLPELLVASEQISRKGLRPRVDYVKAVFQFVNLQQRNVSRRIRRCKSRHRCEHLILVSKF